MEVIKYGRLSIRLEALNGLSWVEAKETFHNVKESLLKGAWDIANPKTEKKKKDTEEAK